jgi:hypothetical protein
VTPVGLLAFAAVLGPRLAPVFAVARFLGATGSGTLSKILGLELPVYVQRDSRLCAGACEVGNSGENSGRLQRVQTGR